jgi:hypothetical protein
VPPQSERQGRAKALRYLIDRNLIDRNLIDRNLIGRNLIEYLSRNPEGLAGAHELHGHFGHESLDPLRHLEHAGFF